MRSRSHCVLIPILNTQYPVPSSRFAFASRSFRTRMPLAATCGIR